MKKARFLKGCIDCLRSRLDMFVIGHHGVALRTKKSVKLCVL